MQLGARKRQKHFAVCAKQDHTGEVQAHGILLEDELGDVLEKGMRCAGLSVDELSRLAEVPAGRLCDALDYRSDLDAAELGRVARVLGLNEVGVGALASASYPLPEIGPLPFCVNVLSMRHGIGTANAYLITECGADHGMLFDAGGGLSELMAVWPRSVTKLDAIFLTHAEPEHSGGFTDVMRHFAPQRAHFPVGMELRGGTPLAEPAVVAVGAFDVGVLSTPGHALAHNCYLVGMRSAPQGTGLLVAGDLVFAGSAGGGYHCPTQTQGHLRRVMRSLPGTTVIAPGHGPMTTVAHECRYNPFLP
ncbi:MAG TPA: MBL fold metallo-hydrolase [Opitutaceae bacterium]|nr:MBL fold metallo-hydrolase [Opitutaceae bacterium]HRJ45899.1 MBL fold metallo-hydrolase [Opitutaceae bacterium]